MSDLITITNNSEIVTVTDTTIQILTAGVQGPQGIQGLAGEGVNSLGDIPDVNVVGATNGQVLTYNASTLTWISASAAGGVIDHTLLSNIGTNTHAQIDSHIADATIHFTAGSLSSTYAPLAHEHTPGFETSFLFL